MTTFVLLRVEDDDEARTLIDDMAEYSDSPLLTPTQEHTVYATVGGEGLLPAEDMVLTMALAQVRRGDEPSPNMAAMCVLALARIAGRDGVA